MNMDECVLRSQREARNAKVVRWTRPFISNLIRSPKKSYKRQSIKRYKVKTTRNKCVNGIHSRCAGEIAHDSYCDKIQNQEVGDMIERLAMKLEDKALECEHLKVEKQEAEQERTIMMNEFLSLRQTFGKFMDGPLLKEDTTVEEERARWKEKVMKDLERLLSTIEQRKCDFQRHIADSIENDERSVQCLSGDIESLLNYAQKQDIQLKAAKKEIKKLKSQKEDSDQLLHMLRDRLALDEKSQSKSSVADNFVELSRIQAEAVDVVMTLKQRINSMNTELHAKNQIILELNSEIAMLQNIKEESKCVSEDSEQETEEEIKRRGLTKEDKEACKWRDKFARYQTKVREMEQTRQRDEARIELLTQQVKYLRMKRQELSEILDQ